jgi:hypothetical protein
MTVSRKLPIITAIATIIERLTARAATEIEIRGTAAARLRTASQSSTRSRLRTGRSTARITSVRTIGTRNEAPKTIATAAA